MLELADTDCEHARMILCARRKTHQLILRVCSQEARMKRDIQKQQSTCQQHQRVSVKERNGLHHLWQSNKPFIAKKHPPTIPVFGSCVPFNKQLVARCSYMLIMFVSPWLVLQNGSNHIWLNDSPECSRLNQFAIRMSQEKAKYLERWRHFHSVAQVFWLSTGTRDNYVTNRVLQQTLCKKSKVLTKSMHLFFQDHSSIHPSPCDLFLHASEPLRSDVQPIKETCFCSTVGNDLVLDCGTVSFICHWSVQDSWQKKQLLSTVQWHFS